MSASVTRCCLFVSMLHRAPDCHFSNFSLGLQCVLFVPDKRQSTHGARAVLPPSVPRADAVFNIGRAALLVHALLTGATDDLALATQVCVREGRRGERDCRTLELATQV